MGYNSHRLVAPLLQRNNRTVHEDFRVAGHESGHALARWHFGLGIDQVRVTPQVKSNGHIVNGSVRGDPGDCDGDLDFFDRLITIVAGNVGEHVLLGEAKGLRGSDRRKAYSCARSMCESEDAIVHMIAAAEAEAHHILSNNLRALDALATTLCEMRAMTGAQVWSIINHAIGNNSNA